MLDRLLVPSVDPGFLDEAIRVVDAPHFDDPLCGVGELVFEGAPTSYEVLIGVHYVGIVVESGVLFLGLLNALVVQVIE